MAGVIKQRHIGARRDRRELAERASHPALIQVNAQRDAVEAHLLERGSHIARIPFGVRKPVDVLVSRVADHQSDTAGSVSGIRKKSRDGKRDRKQTDRCAHV
jgi:hypothetical protein